MQEIIDVEKERQKTNYDHSRYAPSSEVQEEALVFNPTLEKGETRIFTSFYRRPYTKNEIINDLIFKVNKKTRKVIKIHYDRQKNI